MLSKLEEISKKYDRLVEKMSSESATQDMQAFRALSRESSHLLPIVEAYNRFKRLLSDRDGAKRILDTESDPEMRALAESELTALSTKIESLKEEIKILLLPKDHRDANNVIMEIRPAAGGDEAALFAAALFRMYSMYAVSQGFKIEVNDLNETEIGGIKEVSFMIVGEDAFARFKFESGVHRVQRVPDTETQGRIHTSTATVAVLPEATTVDFKIDEKDLKIDTYRASGAGGQHVNRTESAIRITHLPTNTVVTCQDGRSQLKNREKAMLILQTKLADYFQSQADQAYAQTRKTQVGTGDRSERIRTYNYPQGRITDHRINFTSHNLPVFMNGEIGALLEALRLADIQAKLSASTK